MIVQKELFHAQGISFSGMWFLQSGTHLELIPRAVMISYSYKNVLSFRIPAYAVFVIQSLELDVNHQLKLK
jgi:hypothetical protein